MYISDSLFTSDPVLAIECAFEDLRISMDEVDYMLEMVDTRQKFNMDRAELKVLMEGGTYEDLSYLYEASEKDSDDQKGGILKTIWGKIARFFSDIGKAFTNVFTKCDDDKGYSVPQGFSGAVNALCDATEKTKQGILSVGKGKAIAAFAAISAAVTAIGVALKKFGGIAWNKLTEKISGRDAKKMKEKLENASTEISENENGGNISDEEGNQTDDEGKTLRDRFSELVKSFSGKLSGAFKKCLQVFKNIFSGKKATDGVNENDNTEDEEEKKKKEEEEKKKKEEEEKKKKEEEEKKKNMSGSNPSQQDETSDEETSDDNQEDDETDERKTSAMEEKFMESTESLTTLLELIYDL